MSPPPSTAVAGEPTGRRRGGRRFLKLRPPSSCSGRCSGRGWYAYNRGFTRKWREQLAAELRRRGFDFTAAKLTLNPFEGLVAEDADLYLLDAHHTHLLNSNRIAVDIDLRRLIQGKPFSQRAGPARHPAVVARDMADPDGPTLKVRHLNAKVALLPDEVRVTQAEGDFYGLQVSLSGSLLHPKSFSPSGAPASPEERDRRRRWARAITVRSRKSRRPRPPQPGNPFPGRPGATGNPARLGPFAGGWPPARRVPARPPANAARLRGGGVSPAPGVNCATAGAR